MYKISLEGKQKINNIALDEGYSVAGARGRRENCHVTLWCVWRPEPHMCECVLFLHVYIEGIAIFPFASPRSWFSSPGVVIEHMI